MVLAMERGEVQGIGNWHYSSIIANRPDWLRDKKINLILQLGLGPHPQLPDVPTVMDVARTAEERDVLWIVFAQQSIGRPVLGPPEMADGSARDPAQDVRHDHARSAVPGRSRASARSRSTSRWAARTREGGRGALRRRSGADQESERRGDPAAPRSQRLSRARPLAPRARRPRGSRPAWSRRRRSLLPPCRRRRASP